MDFSDTPHEASFRAEARAWLAGNAIDYRDPLPQDISEHELVRLGRAWMARKAQAGYATITWPPEVGGRGGTAMEERIFDEEEGRYHVPYGPFVSMGVNLALPMIRKHGTPAQYNRFATPTLRGEMIWCQLFSEPSAGSDLANVRTRAVKDDDRWIVNGQKVWSSWAHHADWGFLLARTDPSVPKHRGLTMFLLDMRTPGIDIRPIRQINGRADFNETFFADVIIPEDRRVGALGEGWACAMTILANERASAMGEGPDAVRRLIERSNAAPPERRISDRRLADWYATEQGLRFFGYRLLTALSRGERPPPTSAMVKLVSSHLSQQVDAAMMDIDDFAGLFATRERPEQEALFQDYLWSAVMRIAGGADEVLRNQLAERVLGMPSEPRLDKDVPFAALGAGILKQDR